MTPENKASNSLRTANTCDPTAPTPGREVWFVAIAPPPRSSGHTRDGNKYPRSSQNQSCPSRISSPQLGRKTVPRKPTRLPCFPARAALKTPQTFANDQKVPRSPTEGWGSRLQTHRSSRALALRHPTLPHSLSIPATDKPATGPAGHPGQNLSKINYIARHPPRLASQHRPRGVASLAEVAAWPRLPPRGPPLPVRPPHGRMSGRPPPGPARGGSRTPGLREGTAPGLGPSAPRGQGGEQPAAGARAAR